MVDASLGLAVINAAVAVLGLLGRTVKSDKENFWKKHKSEIRDLNESKREAAINEVESVMTPVIKYERKRLLEETPSTDGGEPISDEATDVVPDADQQDPYSPLTEVLDEAHTTDLSLESVVDSEEVTIYESVDNGKDVPRRLSDEIGDHLETVDRVNEILKKDTKIQNRRDLSYIGVIVSAFLGVLAFVVLSTLIGLEGSDVVIAGSAGFLLISGLCGVGTAVYEAKHRLLDDELNEMFIRDDEKV